MKVYDMLEKGDKPRIISIISLCCFFNKKTHILSEIEGGETII